MIKDSQILVVVIVDKNVVQHFITSLNQNIPDAEYCSIKQPMCVGTFVYPAETIYELFAKLNGYELSYVAILQDSYLADIPNIRIAIQKYEAEYCGEKRLLTRRIKMSDYIWADDFDLGHDFVFGKRDDVLAILCAKQGVKHSITNNSHLK